MGSPHCFMSRPYRIGRGIVHLIPTKRRSRSCAVFLQIQTRRPLRTSAILGRPASRCHGNQVRARQSPARIYSTGRVQQVRTGWVDGCHRYQVTTREGRGETSTEFESSCSKSWNRRRSTSSASWWTASAKHLSHIPLVLKQVSSPSVFVLLILQYYKKFSLYARRLRSWMRSKFQWTLIDVNASRLQRLELWNRFLIAVFLQVAPSSKNFRGSVPPTTFGIFTNPTKDFWGSSEVSGYPTGTVVSHSKVTVVFYWSRGMFSTPIDKRERSSFAKSSRQLEGQWPS